MSRILDLSCDEIRTLVVKTLVSTTKRISLNQFTTDPLSPLSTQCMQRQTAFSCMQISLI